MAYMSGAVLFSVPGSGCEVLRAFRRCLDPWDDQIQASAGVLFDFSGGSSQEASREIGKSWGCCAFEGILSIRKERLWGVSLGPWSTIAQGIPLSLFTASLFMEWFYSLQRKFPATNQQKQSKIGRWGFLNAANRRMRETMFGVSANMIFKNHCYVVSNIFYG